ncbi:SRPBCC domain-containing protein [Glycomyces halotolerans]
MTLLIIALVIVAALVGYAVWALRRDERIETSAAIDAPAHEVWAVLTDFDSYGEWNPFITAISGQLAEGERLRVTMRQSNGRPFHVRPTVLRVSPARQIRWLGRLGTGGMFDAEHYFLLEPQADGTTVLVHGERFTGVLVPLMKRTLADTEQSFISMNGALAERVTRA